QYQIDVAGSIYWNQKSPGGSPPSTYKLLSMACATCQSGSPAGCQSSGHCATGGCNKMNTYDWLAQYDFEDPTGTDIIEVSFKKGARKEFFRNHPTHPAQVRDIVVVDTGSGYDIGTVSLAGELVRLQMKKKRVKE